MTQRERKDGMPKKYDPKNNDNKGRRESVKKGVHIHRPSRALA